MTFNEQNVERDTVGRFSDKRGSAPELSLSRDSEIAAARDADTRIAEAWEAYHKIADKASALYKSAMKTRNSLGQYSATTRERLLPRIDKQFAERDRLLEEAAPLRAAAEKLDKELYKGWNRFFLVEHIHSNMHCSSFRPTTRVAWLPNVSGLTEAEAVKEHGATLCTICFPSAPTELTTKPVDETICSGTGSYLDRDKPHRVGYYSGNWGTCPECGEQVTLTSARKLRKHKRGS